MKISSFVHLDAKFCEFHVFSVEFSNRYYSKFLMKIPYVFKGQTNFTWSSMKDPILHIELRRWADLMVIAPLDANTMAKISCGLCDNLLTCTIRAWDVKKPLLFCPAMNTFMWEHPITSVQVKQLIHMGYTHIPPIKKTLACGDTGVGAMAEVPIIVSHVKNHLQRTSDQTDQDVS
ncbi:phosphopantothenoylcysteine decarboxylase-like isoform X2 [Acropora palmata]|uniref:phosphopantothenoylcysteine decarboxylase-like isoform X2 n=1 Tax=Acropora palmata TaxID=6131 RepID=UPI003DA1788D